MPTITVTVKCSNDQKYSVTIDTSKTVLEFKNAIAEQSNTAADRQRLIYSGRVLKDNDTLETYKITEGHTVHMVRSQASSDTSQTSSRTTPPANANANANANTQENPPSTTQPGVSPSTIPGANPFAQFGYGGYNQNPYVLPEQILQNPAMMQYFQQMIQDPTFIESMIAMNPNLSQFAPQLRQMLQDPEVLALISNPETLRNMHSMMAPLVFGGGGNVPGFPGATTNNNNNTTNTNTTPTSPSSGTTNTDNTTTPATPANNPLFFNLFNPAATTTTGTGTNPAQTPVMPLFDPALWGALAMPPVGGGSASPAAPQIPPEERFQVQLRQLNEMGFFDAQKNIRALQVCQGNVNLAIERLLDPSFN